MSHLARRHPVQHLLQSAPPPRVAISGKLRRGLAIGRGSFVLQGRGRRSQSLHKASHYQESWLIGQHAQTENGNPRSSRSDRYCRCPSHDLCKSMITLHLQCSLLEIGRQNNGPI